MKVNIGKNTLGDNNKMTLSLREYGRSSHDLSYAWRSSMGVGSLVPFMAIPALPGDTFKIDLDTKVTTDPTIGPLFGSYKLQMDIFTCPIRLYNAQLHNNALNIGLNMKTIKIPKIELNQNRVYDSSSLLAYLGTRGTNNSENKHHNAIKLLAYYDIFKNYYANKQEKEFYVIGRGTGYITYKQNNGSSIHIESTNCTTYQYKSLTGASLVVKFPKTLFTKEELQSKLDTGHLYVEHYSGYVERDLIIKIKQTNITTQIQSSGDEWIAEISFKGNTDIEATNNNGTCSEQLKRLVINGVNLINEDEVGLFREKLEELDELREQILTAGKKELILNNNNALSIINSLEERCLAKLGGLCVKTHFSDLFNNWVNSEWVDGENGISKLTAVDTSKGSFTMDTLNLAKKVYEMLNRIAVSGGTYKDWIETVYTTDYYFRAETPVYEGGMSSEIEFEPIVSNSASVASGEEEPLGTLAGRGFESNKKGGNITIKVNEPCYIIGIVSITPRTDYSQGNEWDDRLDNLDDFHKPQLDGIGYQDLLGRLAHYGSNDNAAYGKQPAWINYMTNFNKTYGDFAVGGTQSFMVLNRIYNIKNGHIMNFTTYINPKDYTYIFAVNSPSAQNFKVQIGCGIESRRVMSAKQIPTF